MGKKPFTPTKSRNSRIGHPDRPTVIFTWEQDCDDMQNNYHRSDDMQNNYYVLIMLDREIIAHRVRHHL